MELKGKKIGFLGDSITQGVGVSAQDKIYLNLIAAETGAICLNYGISGTRIARQSDAAKNGTNDNNYCYRYLKMDEELDVVIVFGGTNDFGHGDAPLGEFTDRTLDTYYGALHTLFMGLIERYPDATIVALTPLHRSNEDSLIGDRKPAPVANLKTYVEILREVAEYYSIPLLDLYAAGGMQPKVEINKQKYMPDGLHPNDAGHRIIADRLKGLLSIL